jgi:hypothetical protein
VRSARPRRCSPSAAPSGSSSPGPLVEALSYHWLFWLPMLLTAVARRRLAVRPASPVRTEGRIDLRAAACCRAGWSACCCRSARAATGAGPRRSWSACSSRPPCCARCGCAPRSAATRRSSTCG